MGARLARAAVRGRALALAVGRAASPSRPGWCRRSPSPGARAYRRALAGPPATPRSSRMVLGGRSTARCASPASSSSGPGVPCGSASPWACSPRSGRCRAAGRDRAAPGRGGLPPVSRRARALPAVHTLRYAMPYVPLLALFAASGIAAACAASTRGKARLRRRSPLRRPPPAARWRCPGSPPTRPRTRRARGDAGGAARSGGPGATSSPATTCTSRFFALAPAGITALPPPAAPGGRGPRRGVARGEPRSRPLRGRAAPDRPRVHRPRRAHDPRALGLARPRARLLSGERPDAADLVEIRAAAVVRGTGGGCASSAPPPAGRCAPAHRRGSARRGRYRPPAGRGADRPGGGGFECALTVNGAPLDARSCAEPWLAAYSIGLPSRRRVRARRLHDHSRRPSADAPFALRGLAFGPRDALARPRRGLALPRRPTATAARSAGRRAPRARWSTSRRAGARVVVEGKSRRGTWRCR